MRLGGGVLVLGFLLARLGAGPFVDGLRLTSLPALVVATTVTAFTTWCCAWRWQLVAGALGVRLELPAAVAAVYRAQFLNATLPAGVLGDVDRALRHGRGLGPGVRAVVWERTLGQVVQVLLTVAVLSTLASPLRSWGLTAAALAGGALGITALLGLLARSSRAGRVLGGDAAAILRPRRTRVGVAMASAGSVAGHVVVLLVAVRVAGVSAPLHQLLPLAAVVLLAAAVPLNVAGWGPREGVAAWAFGMAGLGAAAGVTASVVYGVMALVATLPGAVVLLAAGHATPADPVDPGEDRRTPDHGLEEVARG